MTAASCPYCGIVIRRRRKDERCVGCGKLLPKELQAEAAEVPPLLPPVHLNPKEPGGAWLRLKELFLLIYLGSVLLAVVLAFVGLPLFVMYLLGLSNLALIITGAVLVLCCPFVVFFLLLFAIDWSP